MPEHPAWRSRPTRFGFWVSLSRLKLLSQADFSEDSTDPVFGPIPQFEASMLNDTETRPFDSLIGRLDRILSEMIAAANDPSLDAHDRQTLKHHAEDMMGAGAKVLELGGHKLPGSIVAAALKEDEARVSVFVEKLRKEPTLPPDGWAEANHPVEAFHPTLRSVSQIPDEEFENPTLNCPNCNVLVPVNAPFCDTCLDSGMVDDSAGGVGPQVETKSVCPDCHGVRKQTCVSCGKLFQY